MRQFDVAHHQPHPPGYPLFVLSANAMHRIVSPEWRALGLLSVVSAALGIVAVFALIRQLAGPLTAFLTALLAATTPLYWFTAVRPLSDSLGLAAAVAIQALILSAASPRAFIVAAFAAGLGVGIRSQVLWLTAPVLVYIVSPRSPVPSPRSPVPSVVAFTTGLLLWFIPLVVLSGGPAAYWHALFDQGAEDLSGIQMLWTSPHLRTLADALYFAFVAPWATWVLAVPIVFAAAAGFVILARRNARALLLLTIAFGPYFVFDILFQETFTVRYALPLIVPIATLAAAAVAALPQSLAIAAAVPLAMYGAHIGGRSIAEYSRQPAPIFRMLTDMRAARQADAVLAPDRRLSFDLRRPLRWLGDAAPSFSAQLAAPPQHEWLEAVKYLGDGGQEPIWFAVDPRRAAIDLIQHGEPRRYRYALPYPALLSGARPGDVDWYSVSQPTWFVGPGWSLTPEAAGVANSDHKGLAWGPIQGWLKYPLRGPVLSGLMIGGRNFESRINPTLTVSIDGVPIKTIFPRPGPFLELLDWQTEHTALHRLEIRSDPPARVAIEQFDFARPQMIGFGEGWHEREFNPVTGDQWRWLSRRGELRYFASNGSPTLRIRGENPLRYYSKGSRLRVRAGERVLSETTVNDDFSIDVQVPPAPAWSTLTVETDQTHVPADSRWRRSADRRELGLRIYSCEIVQITASAPGTAANSPPAR